MGIMSAPFSFTVRPPSSSTAPVRPSPLANGSRANSSRAGPPSRRLFENGQDDSDEEDGGIRSGEKSRGKEREDTSTNSRASGSGSSKPAAPLVIPALPNRDWRESSRRVPTFRPEAPKREASDLETHERIGDGPAKVGLEFFGKNEQTNGHGDGEQEAKVEVKQERDLDGSEHANGHAGSNGHGETVKAEPLSLEEQALAELLAGETHKETAEERAQREMVIAMQANDNTRILSESEALQRDIHSLPAESTLEDFEAVPISAFGIAALRGMGWDPNSTENVKPREVQRRPQLLGLGATALEVPLDPGKSRKEREREKEKKEKKKSREERTGRGFSAASLLLRTPTASGAGTPVNGSSRAGSVDTGNGTGTESDASRRRRREEDGDGARDTKRRDERERDVGRDRDGDRDRDRDRNRDREPRRYETDEERDRRKAKERERYDHDRDRDPRDRDRERSDRDRSGRDGNSGRDRDGERYRDRRDDDRDRERRRDRD